MMDLGRNRGLLWLLVCLALLYWLAPVLTPFVVAAVLAYIGDPLVDRLERWRLPRTLGVVLVFVVLTSIAITLLLILIPMLERQFLLMAAKLPTYLEWLSGRALPWLSARLGVELPALEMAEVRQALQQHWQSAGGLAASLFRSVTQSGLAFFALLANLVLIPVVAFYLLRDWDLLVARVHSYLPHSIAPRVALIAREADEVLGAFLRGQLTVMLALALVYAVGLSLVGLDLAILIGLLAGLVSFVPYLGVIVGMVVAVFAGVMQFQEWMPLLYIALVFGVGQLLEGMLLTPMLVGDRIGLHPVTVIFAVLAGGQLFGFLGVLLALPVAAVIAVILRHFHEWSLQTPDHGVGVEQDA
ncbi:MAG: AI-2E family transporter [Gammaproteobacteria bacterium]